MSQYAGSNAILPHGPQDISSDKWTGDLAGVAAVLAANSNAKAIDSNGGGEGFAPFSSYSTGGASSSVAAQLCYQKSLNGGSGGNATGGGGYPTSNAYSSRQASPQHQWQGIRLPTTPHISPVGTPVAVSSNGCNWNKPPLPASPVAISPLGGSFQQHNLMQPDRHSNNNELRRPSTLHQGALLIGSQSYGQGSVQTLESASLSGGAGAFSVLSSPLLSPVGSQQWIGPNHREQQMPCPRTPSPAMIARNNSLSPGNGRTNYLRACSGNGAEEYISTNAVRLLQESAALSGLPNVAAGTFLPSSFDLDMLRSLTSSSSQVNPASTFSGSSTGNILPHQFTLSSARLTGTLPQSTSAFIAQHSSLSPDSHSISARLLSQLEQQMQNEHLHQQISQLNCPTNSLGLKQRPGGGLEQFENGAVVVKQERQCSMDENTLEAAQTILSLAAENTIPSTASPEPLSSNMLSHSEQSINNILNGENGIKYQPISPASDHPQSPEQSSQSEGEHLASPCDNRAEMIKTCNGDKLTNGGSICGNGGVVRQRQTSESSSQRDEVPMEVNDSRETSDTQQKVNGGTGYINGIDDETKSPNTNREHCLQDSESAVAGVRRADSPFTSSTLPQTASISLTIQAVSEAAMKSVSPRDSTMPTLLQPTSRSTPASSCNSSLSPVSNSNQQPALRAVCGPILSGIPPNVHTCQICGFTSASKFHFISHTNTHSEHRCQTCDYTSRTEGRLKRHMRDSHHRSALDPNSGDPPIDTGSDDESLLLPDSHSDADISRDSATPGSQGAAKERSSSLSSKPKTYKCKQCAFVAQNKNEFWSHARSHIKGDKLLTCPKCSFVTEYKHHLEYHLRNHWGSKPFQCTKCNYSCVNKSMLNSHLKSHSNFYQYRCSDCTYATKYCHSLKLHLRKYGHNPATVVNPDGTMVEAETIDVYGNRRGPRPKKTSSTPPLSGISTFLQSAIGHSSDSGMPTTPLVPFMEALQSSLLAQASVMQSEKSMVASSSASIAYGASLPTMANTSDMETSASLPQLPESALMSPTRSSNSNGGTPATHVFKCSLCDYQSFTRDALTQHMVVHIAENKELCRVYGISTDNIPSVAAQLTSAVSASKIPSNQSDDNRVSSNKDDADGHAMNNQSTQKQFLLSKSGSFRSHSSLIHLNNSQEHQSSSLESSPNGSSSRFSPSHEVSQSSNSPASASGERKSEDEGNPYQSLPTMNRRKGKAYKLDKIALKLQGKLSPSTSPSSVGEGSSLMQSGAHQSIDATIDPRSGEAYGDVSNEESLNSRSRQLGFAATAAGSVQQAGIDWSKAYICHYCDIAFKDCIMYTMHMGYHGYQEPYRCNMCGHMSEDRLSMFLHIARAPHGDRP